MLLLVMPSLILKVLLKTLLSKGNLAYVVVIFHNYHPFLGIEVAIKKVDQLIAPVAASANTSKGIKGIEVSDDAAYASASRKNSSKDHVDAINQMFAEFELAYHNQYHKAFPDEGALNLAKKYWLTSLAAFFS